MTFARAQWVGRVVVCVSCFAWAACERSEPGSASGAWSPTQTTSTLSQAQRAGGVQPPNGLRFLGGETEDTILRAIVLSNVEQLSHVGSSSIVFRADLKGPIDAAFKPHTSLHPFGHLSEVAAFRIARLLGLDDLPPAELRVVPGDVIKNRLVPSATRPWTEVQKALAWDGQGNVVCAAIYWVPDMQPMGLDTSLGVKQWTSWLSQAEALPKEREMLARDMSNVVLFDYLIGNWDRYSGGNLLGDKSRSRIVIRDHNLAFRSPLPERLHERVLRTMMRAERFSRSVVVALRRLDERALKRHLRYEGPGQKIELLTDAQVRDILDRRDTILSRVSVLAARYGNERVLVFP